jgi:hypothetical protein
MMSEVFRNQVYLPRKRDDTREQIAESVWIPIQIHPDITEAKAEM